MFLTLIWFRLFVYAFGAVGRNHWQVQGHLGGSVGYVFAFSASHDPRVLRLSHGLVGDCFFPCSCSLQVFRNKEQRNRWQIQCHIVLGLNNFELTLCMVWGRRSDFPSSVCSKVCLLPTKWLWHPVRNLWRFRGLISIWGFGSGLFICMTLVPVRHAVVSQEVWVLQCFLDCVGNSGSLTLLPESEDGFLNFCKKMLVFYSNFIESVACFEQGWHFNNTKSSHEYGAALHL